ncbi:MAG: hypothetical protein HOQ31_16375 [Gemmatimonadaceae bacterium]|nr:hypothetical protein [Gemmatimonadaceae bacterium]
MSCPIPAYRWDEPTIVGWSVTVGPRDDDDLIVLGFFLTSADAWMALADLMEAERRRRPKPVFSVVPVYSAEPGNLRRVYGQPASKICRMNGCGAFVGTNGFEGYCEDCADDVFGRQSVADVPMLG